jgi:hypothetical protein
MRWTGWGIPNDIPVPPGGDGAVPPWPELKFSPLGVYNLRRRIGVFPEEPGIFMRYRDRFLHTDVAWFASGLHNDGQHGTSHNTFHSLFHTARLDTGTGETATKLRNKLRDSVRDHIFDMVSLLEFFVLLGTQTACRPHFGTVPMADTRWSCIWMGQPLLKQWRYPSI